MPPQTGHSPSVWPDGYGRRILDEVDSTNAEAARIAPDLSGPEWILGLKQNAGRGRRGRAWVMPSGNFAATLVLQPPGPQATWALRSFVAALALHDALVDVTGGPECFALKWPNDVLLNGGKLAGILLEGLGARHLAIGIGVNLADIPAGGELPEGALAPVSLLSGTGVTIAPETFLEYLAASYAERERELVTYGFAPIRAAWLERAARLGQEIVARTATSETRGLFDTIDEEGYLLLKTDSGPCRIAAADIYF
ncbi:BirA family transcriptional regulator, biotin operon repressor / biotin-[acetyl-CoA-carboxylase] ligase [Poseidonocella pacifica]|uniref:biotin--[biotin carboxyl-carrier protein] ligase n=1 Tax=Poseidonocella pacifica TaxID=871651 RepID=A0A1I0V7B9_9RHOB|nr:BirA family transcriptional regulator, biotin operon repressor / biotin-[acetyl-CoA-carboxylase] ligase [Poseidonocella pacifica]